MGYYLSTVPPEEDPNLPRDGNGYTGGGGGGSDEFDISGFVDSTDDYQVEAADGWCRATGNTVSWAFSLWGQPEPPEHLYLRTRFVGEDEDCAVMLAKIGETEVPRNGG